MKKINLAILAAFVSFSNSSAFAAKGWEKDIVSFTDDLNSGLVQVFVPLIGIAILFFAGYSLFQGKINKEAGFALLFAGTLITVGPSAAKVLFS